MKPNAVSTMDRDSGSDSEKGKISTFPDKITVTHYAGIKPPGKEYEAKCTAYVVLVICVAAGCGLLFGFDNGIIGGVTGSAEFQVHSGVAGLGQFQNFPGARPNGIAILLIEEKFLPTVYRANFLEPGTSTNYCKYDSQVLQLIVSCLYLAAGVVAPFAGLLADNKGRNVCMLLAGISFGAGIVLLASAQNIAMVVIGRVLMGGGVGFANSSSVLYIVEMAPFKWRGGMGIMFQLVQTIGILVAYVYNYAFNTIDWGWRLAFALGGVFAIMVIAGSLFLPDTPISLLQRGRPDEAREVLERVRGTKNVDAEFEDMLQITEAAKKVPNSFKSLLFNPRYRPQLATVISMPIFQQWTGINSVIFYTPQIFSYVGRVKGLEDTVVVGAVNVAATVVASVCVDLFGRKILFTQGGLQMAVCMIIIASTLGTEYGKHPNGDLPTPVARGLLAVFCTFAAGYAWSFGPLPWLLPSEVQPLETRAAAASINTTLNMLMTFVLSQTFQSQLCAERFGVFLFFAGLEVLFVVLIILFLPETKGRTMDQIAVSFSRHWFWGRLRHVREYGEERGAFADDRPEGSMPALAVGH